MEAMKLLVFGNSGSGKSTFAKAISERCGLQHLDLDNIVREPGKIAVAREPGAVRADLDAFRAAHDRWVIEGCYGKLIEVAAPACDDLIFLNPARASCLANNRLRALEPHKYATPEAQDAMLDHLQAWVEGYYERDDAWSLATHRRVFDAHPGMKVEYTRPATSDLIDRRCL